MAVFLVHEGLLGVLLEVGDVMGCMSSLKDCVGSLGLLFAFPKEVLSKTDSELGCEHVSAGCSRRESELMWGSVGGGLNDGLSS